MKLKVQKVITLLLLVAAFTVGSKKASALGYYGNFGYTASGLKVSFYDSTYTTWGFTKWHWSFGDGDTSTTKNPVHTYLQGGSYNVVMVVYDNVYNYWDTVKKK